MTQQPAWQETEALRLPDLELATAGSRLARERCVFPLRSNLDLLPLFDAGELRLHRQTLSFDEVARFLPPQMFPIYDPLDFLGKAIVGLLGPVEAAPEVHA
jgi:hypothetical protein